MTKAIDSTWREAKLSNMPQNEDKGHLKDICSNIPEHQEVLVYAASPVFVEHPHISVFDLYLQSESMLFEAVLVHLEGLVSENLMRASGEELTRYVCHNCSWAGTDHESHTKLAKYIGCTLDAPIEVLEEDASQRW